MKALFRIVDTETTGFDPKTEKLVEIAWRDVVLNGRDLKYLGSSRTFVDPEKPIPPQARAVHHISDRMVQGAPAPATAVAGLLQIPEGLAPGYPAVLVAHNARFDRGFIEAAWGGSTPRPWLCTYRLAKHVWPDADSYSNGALFYRAYPERELTSTHRAADDCIVTEHVLFALLEAIDAYSKAGGLDGTQFEGPHELVAYAESAIDLSKRPVGFGKYASTVWSAVPKDYLHWMVREDQKQLKETGEPAWDRDQWCEIHKQLGWPAPPITGRK